MKLPYKIAMHDIAYIRLHEAISSRNPDVDKSVIAQHLAEFEVTHGENSLISMFGWYLHCKARKLSVNLTWPAISRDLNMRNIDCSLLTSGYGGVCEKWFEIEILIK